MAFCVKYKLQSSQPSPTRISRELRAALTCPVCQVSGLILVSKNEYPKLLVGESYDKEFVDHLLHTEVTEPMEEVLQLPNHNVQDLVRDLIQRGLDNIWMTARRCKPKKKLALPIDKVRTFFLPQCHLLSVIFFQPKSMYVKFQPGVRDGDDLAFFLQENNISSRRLEVRDY